MLVAGALLWQKKRIKESNRFSFKLVHHLNVFTFLGLPLACVSYLLMGRLLPTVFEPRVIYEVTTFYLIWLLSLFISLISSSRTAVLFSLTCTALILFSIPLSNFILIPEVFLWNSLIYGRWLLVGVDLTFLLLGFVYAWAIYFYLKKFKPVGVLK